MFYRKVLKPVLFRMDPERAHRFVMGGLKLTGSLPGGPALIGAMAGGGSRPELSMELWGLRFANPVGLAAGLDKNGEAVAGFSALGFGFVEIGTVTPRPQPGNERPRLFRLPSDEALINRMGFNNEGAERLARRLERLGERSVPVAVNIGKNKTTPNERAAEDYVACIRQLYRHADLFVINVSSPNTPDLRKLQHGDELRRLLESAAEEMERQRGMHGRKLPMLVKIAPDLSDDELERIVETVSAGNVSGIIATNTTIRRDGLTHGNAKEAGGLSGKPLRRRSTEIVRRIYKLTKGKLPIVGAGGIFSAEDAYEKIRAGASLVEIYTGLIYRGPGIVREITGGLCRLLAGDGFGHISHAIGADAD